MGRPLVDSVAEVTGICGTPDDLGEPPEDGPRTAG